MALRTGNRQLFLPMRVWDAPTRLFHWVIVLLVAFSYATSQLAGLEDTTVDWMHFHVLSGYAVLALLIFRLVWGFIGSETSRFRHFIGSPLLALRHLAHFREREPDTQVGHNQAGGWMVLVMLVLLAGQVGTGLFSNDDGATEGPLAKYVGKAASDQLSGVHSLLFNLLLAAIILHVLAVAGYLVIKKHNLIRPMITGKKRLPAATPAPRMASPALALAILVVAALVVWVLATRA